MDLNQLRAFVAVATAHSFSAAAEALHLTQPAISKRISALERSLQIELFDRSTRSARLTVDGRELLVQARELLSQARDLETAMRNRSGTVGGVLTLATSHHIGLHRLPALLRGFAHVHPEVQLHLRFEDSEVGHQLVRNGEVDLALVTLDPLRGSPLRYQCLWQDPLSFVISPKHPLAQLDEVRMRDLCHYNAILPGQSTYTGRLVTGAFAVRGVAIKIAMSTNYLETIRMLVSVGLGWSALPNTMLDASVQQLRVMDDPLLTRELGYVQDPQRTPSNAASAFIELLVRSLEPDPTRC